MAYVRSNIVARRSYMGAVKAKGPLKGALSGVTDTLKDFFGGVWSGFSTVEQQKGAAEQAQIDAQKAISAQQKVAGGGGISGTDVALLGGAGLAAYFLLRKKPKAASGGGGGG